MKPSEEQIAQNLAAGELLHRHLKPGDVITHTRCMGALEEHIFTGWHGNWICGKATQDTLKYSHYASKLVDDIGPCNVTHVNREAVGALDLLAELHQHRIAYHV